MDQNVKDRLRRLSSDLTSCLMRDRHRFRRKLETLKKSQKQDEAFLEKLASLEVLLAESIAICRSKNETLPEISFDDALPIASRREDIAKAIENNQVVVLAGETGSGKTTQLPKICLSLGRGINGQIGHTQPRRIAARTVANRIAEELNTPLGEGVGYKVRFTDQASEKNYIKLMTDGILLAEIQSDPYLNNYDTLILDEAHERSLNIDFLLGYLKQLLPKRPDLKLIITSATINVARFSAHFNNAPVIEVSGRTFPVETRYRPWHDDAEDINEAIIASLEEILNESRGQGGDVLVFLSGERDIRALSLDIKKANLAGIEVLPLYARLNLTEQQRVFQSSRSRKVVLATNVAETSITVPGIRYVIDTGFARISRYSLRTKVQRLPIEPISQASANQRQGRCGRVSNGICYRLYSEEDFLSRPAFTDPELLRTNLAAVVLQMLQLRMGKVEDFPFVDKPDTRLINDGYRLLEELQAVNRRGKITKLGKQLSQLAVDPKFARMIVEAGRLGCLNEVLIIVSALSLQDPRERPSDKQQAADQAHKRFFDEQSDFIAYVNLWNYVEAQRSDLSQNQFRKLCKKEFFNFMRLKEWRELHYQLKLQAKSLGLRLESNTASAESIHQSLLVGLLSNVARRDDEEGSREYIGTRSRKCMIFPGSALKKKKFPWLVAADFIETSQVYAHCVAKIDPAWVVDRAQHIVKHHYSEAHYDAKSGGVKAFDKISLWGLVLVEKKRVDYAKIDAKLSREIFMREALVEEKYRGKAKFFLHNKKLIEEVKDLEAKARRRDILVDDESIFAFYAERIPESVCNQAGLEHWLKQVGDDAQTSLKLAPEQIMLHGADNISEAQFPDKIKNGDFYFPVTYEFEPTRKNDGVNVMVPVDLLHQVDEASLQWLVPGLLHDKCCALVKTLPKQKRKNFVPVPAFVDRALARMKAGSGSLTESLAEQLQFLSRMDLSAGDFREEALDSFYTANIVVLDDRNRVLDQARQLSVLRERYRDKVQSTLEDIGSDIERSDLESWDMETLPESVELKRGAVMVKAFPALVAEPGKRTVDLKLYDNPLQARFDSNRGICRLALAEIKYLVKDQRKNLLKGKELGLSMVSLGKRDDVVDELLLAAVRRSCFGDELLIGVRSKSDLAEKVSAGKADFVDTCHEYECLILDCLAKVVEIRKKIKSTKNALAMALSYGDIQAQINMLFQPGLLFDTPWGWLQHLPRYLDAALTRIEKAPQKAQADRAAMIQVQALQSLHEERLEKLGSAEYLSNSRWIDYRWMLEELRVSLFAQTLKTSRPVSEKRLKKAFAEI